jgi:hypothetical protein
VLVVVTLLLIVLAIGLIAASPAALELYGGATGEWERLSFIGQTYGAASAVLSVLAVIGVVVTLRLQARETKLAREEARRQAIADLLKMAMDDPDLSECWGPTGLSDPPKVQRQQIYVNLIVSEWRQSYESKALPERRLRRIANEMFQGEPGRSYWRGARENRLSTSGSGAERRFHEILDEEYRHALAAPAAVASSGDDTGRRGRSNGRRRTVTWLTASAVAMVTLGLVRRWSRGDQGRRSSAKRARWSLPGRS